MNSMDFEGRPTNYPQWVREILRENRGLLESSRKLSVSDLSLNDPWE